MTTITLKKNQEGTLTGFTASGHTNFEKRGGDIVCASASGVIQTAVLGLKNFCELVKFEKTDGYIEINVVPDAGSEIIIKTMLLGLENLEQQYPKNVKVKK